MTGKKQTLNGTLFVKCVLSGERQAGEALLIDFIRDRIELSATKSKRLEDKSKVARQQTTVFIRLLLGWASFQHSSYPPLHLKTSTPE